LQRALVESAQADKFIYALQGARVGEFPKNRPREGRLEKHAGETQALWL
jgi:hypothetical protein